MKTIETTLPEKGATVAVGMSGGVDSTLVTILLKERGCHVFGVTMSSWNHDMPLSPSENNMRSSCYGPDEAIDIEACKKFCAENGIEHYVIDVKEAYQREVLDYFKKEYRSGRTPNPCIMCNPRVKFGALLEGITAMGLHFDYFCTGHYARLVRADEPVWSLYGDIAPAGNASAVDSASAAAGNASAQASNASAQACSVAQINPYPLFIEAASDVTKDQAYFLYRIPSIRLEKVRFPLGSMTKKEVFEIARERKLEAANRSESQDFVPPEYFDIIFSDKPSVPGDIIDLDGHVLGRHRGIEHYTIGQRRGLGVSSTRPLYVHSIDAKKNLVILADNDDLNSASLTADDWVWAGNYSPRTPFNAMVKIRLASRPVEALVEPMLENVKEAQNPTEYRIIFKNPQRAVAPGQSVVVYLNGLIMGGGLIKEAIPYVNK